MKYQKEINKISKIFVAYLKNNGIMGAKELGKIVVGDRDIPIMCNMVENKKIPEDGFTINGYFNIPNPLLNLFDEFMVELKEENGIESEPYILINIAVNDKNIKDYTIDNTVGIFKWVLRHEIQHSVQYYVLGYKLTPNDVQLSKFDVFLKPEELDAHFYGIMAYKMHYKNKYSLEKIIDYIYDNIVDDFSEREISLIKQILIAYVEDRLL